MKTYLRILSYISPHKKNTFLYLLLIFVSILFGLITFISVIPLLKVIFEKEQSDYSMLPFSMNPAMLVQYLKSKVSELQHLYSNKTALAFICVVAIGATFFKNLFLYFAQRNLATLRANVIRDIRSDMFEKINTIQLSYYKRRKKGDILSRMTADVQEIENSVINTLNVVFREPVTIIIFYIVLIGISWKLTLITLVLLPFSGYFIGRIAKKLKDQSSTGQVSLGKILSILDETITGSRIIKAFNAQKYMSEKFDTENTHYAKTLRSILNKKDLASPLSEFLGVIVISLVIWFGGMEIFNQTSGLAPEDFIGYIIIYSQILTPAKAFSSAISNIQRGIASGDRIFNVIDAPLTIKDKPKALSINNFKHSIEFKNVSFMYEHDYALDSINLQITKGKIIALVGPSGSGKSTLADMIPRYHDPIKGEILLDGVPITEYKITDLRSLMGIVTQEPILFNDTVFNNIAFGINSIPEEEVIKAAVTANAHDFIMELANGYQTNIGDRGLKLSGGEKQRLSIARAILKNPPILILDEATSSLDNESEKLVQEAINKLMTNRTCIIIAHRLSTIKHADEIIVINAGSIVQRGNHNELIEVEGIYKRLNELQIS